MKKGGNKSKREVFYDKDKANKRYLLLKGLNNTIRLKTETKKVKIRIKDPISAEAVFRTLLVKFPGKYKSPKDFPTSIIKTDKRFNESLNGGGYCKKTIYYIPELGVEFIYYDKRI